MKYERALQGSEETLGPMHPETINSRGNLGALLMQQSVANGRTMVEDAFAALTEGENAISPSHPWYIKFSKMLSED